MIVLWCNGSTADFGSVSLGSNPSRTTNLNKEVRLLWSTADNCKIPYTTSLA